MWFRIETTGAVCQYTTLINNRNANKNKGNYNMINNEKLLGLTYSLEW